jgi:thioredoxin 1
MSNYAKNKDLGDQENDKTNIPFVQEIQSLDHKKYLIISNEICIIDIGGDWCGPCKEIAPKFAKLSKKYEIPERCILVKEDVDRNFSPDIRGVPTFQIYNKGKLFETIIGADISKVENILVELLNS